VSSLAGLLGHHQVHHVDVGFTEKELLCIGVGVGVLRLGGDDIAEADGETEAEAKVIGDRMGIVSSDTDSDDGGGDRSDAQIGVEVLLKAGYGVLVGGGIENELLVVWML